MEIQPTNEDRERVRESVENAREQMFEVLVQQEARRRALLRKLSLGLLGR